MPAKSPDTQSTDLVSYRILVNGSPIDSSINVISINITKQINRIPVASIELMDGDATTGDFPISSGSTFIPGNNIEIQLGYNSEDRTVFKGIVAEQNIRANTHVGSTLEVICYDQAIRMTGGRKNGTYIKTKDSDVIKKIISGYSGLTTDVQNTENTLSQLVQYCATDWDFICTRAEANGQVVIANYNKVTTQTPYTNTSSVLTLTYGLDIIDMDLQLDATTQLASVVSSSWDDTTQKVIQSSATQPVAGPGNISSKELSQVIGLSAYQQQTSAPLGNSNLTTWSKAELTWSGLAKIRGSITFQGNNIVEPGAFVTLAGVGDRFNGDVYVSAVEHHLTDGMWTTETELGLPADWPATDTEDISAPQAAGLLPAIQGIHNAVVLQIAQDPDNDYRILVKIPLISDTGVWARLSNFSATNGAGSFFYPEIGDEVLVGFMNNDPRYPVILGSVYSQKNKPPYTADDKNPKKGFVTKTGLKLEFDDENKITTVTTPAKNSFVLNDKDKTITLSDMNGNKLVMSASDISISSPKDINISAEQQVNIKGNMGVTLQASAGDVKLSGMNVKAHADIEASIEGSATASLTGGAQAIIKGAMVMIN